MAEGRQFCFSIGYDEEFASAVDEDFQCLVCHLALREPVLTRCGHRFCRQCLEQCFTWQDGQQKPCPCPVDRVDLVPEKDVFPDKATERKILSFAIKCPSEGCDWTGELRNKEIHLASCIFKLISCTNENCEVRVARKDLEEHVNMGCQWRSVQCGYCHELYPECQLEQHNEECKKLPVECGECGAGMQQEKMLSHIKTVCPLSVIQCPYHQMGCDVKVQREQIESHLESAAKLHLELACVKLNKNQEEFKEITRKLEAKIDALERQVQAKWNLHKQQTADLSININREILKLKQDSPFILKITEFSGLLKSAKRGLETAFGSGVFFTGPVGYKLSLSLHPNGNGYGKNTHVSVYIYLLKGKYDAVLPWPFKKTITFTLIDQQENELYAENVVKKLIPDPSETNVFARPVTDHNTGRGFFRFISHEELRRRRYIVDDTLFLKVQTGPPA